MTPKLPRDISGRDLAKLLKKLGYFIDRQSGSHIILETEQNGRFQVCVPNHKTLAIGTLGDILNDLSEHHALSKDELKRILFES